MVQLSNSSKKKKRNNVFKLFLGGTLCLAIFSAIPLFVLSHVLRKDTSSNHADSLSVHHLVHGRQASVSKVTVPRTRLRHDISQQQQQQQTTRTTKDGRVLPDYTLDDLQSLQDNRFATLPVARGVAGGPLDETPSVVDAKRAHIDCPELNVDSLAYWNAPGTVDNDFTSPFAEQRSEKYITFAPDHGGWNNVRMSMEIIFVIAAATGRTLVLPPKEPLYLLHHDKASRYRGFADFFPIHDAGFQSRVKVIQFATFLEQVQNTDLAPPPELATNVQNAADHCDHRAKSTAACKPVFDYLQQVGFSPTVSAVDTCLIFDEQAFVGDSVSSAHQEHLDTVCGPKRTQVFWDDDLASHDVLHFRASEKQFRLLTHFYGMIHFTNPKIDHYFKRFVRDFLHYHDSIYCAAGKIVKAVQKEGLERGFALDAEGGGGFSALHVRRGDLQYKKVKISAQEWYDNTKEVWQPKEILYVATDEKDKSFFNDLAAHHDLRFLDDYWDLAGLGNLDPNYMGMIDTIVASRGRAFAGTWFSTFSGYINRLRGWHGMSMQDSWYSFLPKKTAVHKWDIVDDFAYAYEWPDGWIGIDRDVFPKHDVF